MPESRPRLEAGGHVAFICIGNHTRSPLAAAMFARHMRIRNIDCKIESAGTLGEMRPNGASQAWSRLRYTSEYDLSGHVSRHYGQLDFTPETFTICLDDMAYAELLCVQGINHDRLQLLLPPNGVYDPGIPSLEAYEMCFWQLKRGLEGLVRELCGE